MIKRLLLVCLLCFPVCRLNAQEITVKRERVFTGTGLYGYMNGGAEQFLEYGVTKLTAYDLEYEGEEYALEIYEMPTPEDAYGIYSLHVFRCQRADTLGCIDCLSSYQLQTVCGSQYVSLVFPSGSKKARQQAEDVLRHFLSQSGEESEKIEFPDTFQSLSPKSGKLKFLRGKIGLSEVSSSLSHLLEGFQYSGVWFIEEDDQYRAIICFETPDQLETLRNKLPSEQICDTGTLFLEYVGKEDENDSDSDGLFGF